MWCADKGKELKKCILSRRAIWFSVICLVGEWIFDHSNVVLIENLQGMKLSVLIDCHRAFIILCAIFSSFFSFLFKLSASESAIWAEGNVMALYYI
jgi:hypothetical protein